MGILAYFLVVTEQLAYISLYSMYKLPFYYLCNAILTSFKVVNPTHTLEKSFELTYFFTYIYKVNMCFV